MAGIGASPEGLSRRSRPGPTLELRGRWRTAQPDRLRAWIFRLPGKLTRHARKLYLQFLRTEPVRKDLLRGLRHLGRAPP